jgi:putative membrane protein (TIGR04086 family)
LPVKKMNEVSDENKGGNIIIIGKGVLLAYIISVLFLAIYGILLAVTSLSESTLPTAVMIITMASIALSSIYAAIKSESKGWMKGALLGFVYMVILFLLSMIFKTGITLDKYVVFRVFMGIVIGLLAGIIGINLK